MRHVWWDGFYSNYRPAARVAPLFCSALRSPSYLAPLVRPILVAPPFGGIPRAGMRSTAQHTATSLYHEINSIRAPEYGRIEPRRKEGEETASCIGKSGISKRALLKRPGKVVVDIVGPRITAECCHREKGERLSAFFRDAVDDAPRAAFVRPLAAYRHERVEPAPPLCSKERIGDKRVVKIAPFEISFGALHRYRILLSDAPHEQSKTGIVAPEADEPEVGLRKLCFRDRKLRANRFCYGIRR